MKNSIITVIITCSILCSATYGQRIPKSEKEVPVFPGAQRDLPAQEYALKDFLEIQQGQPIYDIQLSVYSINSPPDDITRFYIEKLGATEGFPVEEAGIDTKPWYELNYFSESYYEDQYERDTKIWDGKWFRSALAKRKQWTSGYWLQYAYFEWTKKLDNGDLARISVDISDDDSFDTRAKIVKDKTMLTITSYIEKSEEAYEEEQDAIMDEVFNDRLAYLRNNPPTEKLLGVPFYPGWLFRAEQSAGMSLDDEYSYYIFASTDDLKKVLTFYEQKLNKKALNSGFGYIIALKGSLPVPEEGLTIQENTMFDGTIQTVITIQKSNF